MGASVRKGGTRGASPLTRVLLAVIMLPLEDLLYLGKKKQSTIPRSSAEAEYRAVANSTSELIWI